jgi:SPP1 family predicted phage head-tail adaptor
MAAGDLRYRVKFSERDTVEDEYGNPSTAWIDRFTVAANISPQLGGETVIAARLTGRQPVVIRVRRSPDTALIKTDWKATNTADGTEYNIRTAVDPYQGTVEHGKWRDMLAEAGVAV